jgi:hypothetical protein
MNYPGYLLCNKILTDSAYWFSGYFLYLDWEFIPTRTSGVTGASIGLRKYSFRRIQKVQIPRNPPLGVDLYGI